MAMPAQKIEGIVDFIQFPRNGFTKPMEFAVVHVKTENGKKLKAAGEMLACKRGELFWFEGNVEKTKFGDTFKFERSGRSDSGEQGASAYLAYLFGPKTAEKIIKYFKNAEEALEAFKEDPMELTQIKGISVKTVNKGVHKHEVHEMVEVLFTTLKPHGMTMHMALKVYKKYGSDALKKLQDNPYILMYDFESYGFENADLLASYFNVPNHHQNRLEAGIYHVMKRSLNDGHTFLPLNTLQQNAIKVLTDKGNVPQVLISQTLITLIKADKLRLEKGDRVYLPAYYKYEVGVAKHLQRLRGPKFAKQTQVTDIISEFEQAQIQKHSIKGLEQEQKEAMVKATKHALSVVTGPPGSGKTTIINGIIYTLEKIKAFLNQQAQLVASNPTPGAYLRIGLAAPTGKAAKRMTETTGLPAYTLHKLLQYKPQDGHWEFGYNADNQLPYDVIIADEESMLDIQLAYHFLQAIPKGCTVILVGDKDQLESVGAGRVFGDILESNQIPTTFLTKVHRLGGTALERAIQVREGIVPDLTDTQDFTFFEHDDELTLQEKVLAEFTQAVRQFGLDEVVVLTPMNKTAFGVHELNKMIQREINPASPKKAEVKFGTQIFRVGDKVIQKVPNEAEGVVNGQIGYVKSYAPEDTHTGDEEILVIDFDGEEKMYTRDRFDEIQLAYAMTCHKAQGSEWKKIIMPVFDEHKFMLTRRLIYTLWTRMKTHIFLFGSKDVLRRCVKNNRERPRNSLLKDRIRGLVA